MIPFSKMHGAGNDFIIVKAEDINGIAYSKLALDICHRHFGVGADGLMVVEKSHISDIRMIYYNSDGSLGEMCGNGIRCFARFVYHNGIVDKNTFEVETLAGIKGIDLKITNNEVSKVLVNMGKPSLDTKNIPMETNKKTFINEDLIINGSIYKVSSLFMGVPHSIIFVDNIKDLPLGQIGPLIENHPLFINKTNVNLVEIVNKNNIKVDTWERGAGKTLACGTGVCASVYLSKLLNKVESSVKAEVAGGELNITIDEEDNIFMEGNAQIICSGEYYYKAT